MISVITQKSEQIIKLKLNFN